MSAIYRLKQSNDRLSSKHKQTYTEMLELMESTKSFKKYRDTIAKVIESGAPAIPYLVHNKLNPICFLQLILVLKGIVFVRSDIYR